MEKLLFGVMQLFWNDILIVAYWVTRTWMLSTVCCLPWNWCVCGSLIPLSLKSSISHVLLPCVGIRVSVCIHHILQLDWMSLDFFATNPIQTHPRCIVDNCVYYWTPNQQIKAKEITNCPQTKRAMPYARTSSHSVTLVCSSVLGLFYHQSVSSALILS